MTLTELGTVVTLVVGVAGAAFFLDDRHAHDEDVLLLAGEYTKQFQGINRQLLEIRLDSLRGRLWYLQERTGCQGSVRNECEWLKAEIERVIRLLR
jgi:hypothetical protein